MRPGEDSGGCALPPHCRVHSRRHLKFAPTRSHCLAPNPAFALVRAPLRRRVDSHTLFRGSASGLRQPSGGSDEVSLAVSRRRVAFTAWLRFAVGVLCLHSAPPYASVASGFVAAAFSASPACLMPAVPLSQGRCSACRHWCFFSFARVNIRGFNFLLRWCS